MACITALSKSLRTVPMPPPWCFERRRAKDE
jgi:hypothetical protein